jgi:hypothetical protein
MIARILTAQQIKESEGRNYNPQIWLSNVDEMVSKYRDVVFYHVPKDDLFSYDRYFVEYTLDTGLRLFKSFSYSSSMTNGGFYRLDKFPVTADGKDMQDVISMFESGDTEGAKQLSTELINNPSMFKIESGKFMTQDGDMVMINTTKEAREWMTERSIQYGLTFTKGLF